MKLYLIVDWVEYYGYQVLTATADLAKAEQLLAEYREAARIEDDRVSQSLWGKNADRGAHFYEGQLTIEETELK